MAPPQAKTYSSRRLYSVLGPTESNNLERVGTACIVSMGGDILNWETLHVWPKGGF